MSIVRAIRAAVGPDRPVSAGDPEIEAPAWPSNKLCLPFVTLITVMLCLPYFRLVLSLGDEGVLLHGADRMLRGSKLYADFFEFLPPGGFVLTAAWFSVTGVSFPAARALAILTIVGIACFTFLACRLASRNALLSAFIVITWAMVSQGPWTQLSHHWFVTLFSMAAAWAALTRLVSPSRLLRWPLIAGAAVGMAGMVTPTRGALAALAALTAFLRLRQDRASSVAYVLAVALAPVGFVAYLAANHSLAVAFEDVILFTAARYGPIHGAPFGHGAHFEDIPLLAVFPLTAMLTFLVCVRDWRACVRDRVWRLCVAFGLAGFIGCYPHPDIGHVGYAAPLACPLLAWCLTRLTERSHRAFQRIYAAGTIGYCILSIISTLRVGQAVMDRETVPTQRGAATIVLPLGAMEMVKRIDATPPGDAYFFYPHMSLLPFLADREHVSKYDVFIPGYTLSSQYYDACLSVMQKAELVVVDRQWIGPTIWRYIYPAMQNPQPPETLEFERALDRGFEVVAREATFELRRRREDTSEALCSGLAD